MAKSGGIFGVTGVRMFVKNDEPTTVEHFLDHYDHVRDLVGPEFLGIGSDMDLHGYDDLPAETQRMLRANYKGSYGFREKIDIEGIDHPKRVFDVTKVSSDAATPTTRSAESSARTSSGPSARSGAHPTPCKASQCRRD